MLLSAFEDSRFQPSFTFLRPRKKGTFSYLALPHSEQRHGMRAVASRSVVVPPGPSQAGRRDGRIGARVHAVVARASPRARGVRASAAADVVNIPLRQDAMDDTGVSVGSLTRAVMALEDDSAEAMFECILEWATVTKKMELYEAQEEAIMELVEGNSVLLTTPTGSGKTLVATAAIAAATARGDVRTREFHGTHNQRFQTNQTTRGGHPRDETTRRVSCKLFLGSCRVQRGHRPR